MQRPHNDLSKTIDQIEQLLCGYYDLKQAIFANDHLIDSQGFKHHAPDQSGSDLRAATVFSQNDDELFVGIYLHESLSRALVENSPLVRLDQSNLDAFCVLVEELSHFHLICQRAQQNRQLSELELEWQGEIDKLLISALVLKAQDGRWYFQELAHILYDLAIISHSNQQLYGEATKLASGFWRGLSKENLISESGIKGFDLKNFMQTNYHQPWHEKYPIQKSSIKYFRSR